MKKCTFVNDNNMFLLVDTDTQEIITHVNAGNIEDDIDWDIVEEQANNVGYTLY